MNQINSHINQNNLHYPIYNQREINQRVVAIINSVTRSLPQIMQDLEIFFQGGYKVSARVIYQCKELYGLSPAMEQLLNRHRKDETAHKVEVNHDFRNTDPSNTVVESTQKMFTPLFYALLQKD